MNINWNIETFAIIVVELLAVLGAAGVVMLAWEQLGEWRIVPACKSGALGYLDCWTWFGEPDPLYPA